MPGLHFALLAQEDTAIEMEALVLAAAEQWAAQAQAAKEHYTRGGSSVRGSKWTVPIWLLALPARGTSHCPSRRPADGSEARPGAGEESD